MFQLHNSTPFVMTAFPSLNVKGAEILTVVLKGSYDMKVGMPATLSATQSALVLGDQHLGEPGVSSITYESDLTPFKPSTDILMVGTACAPEGRKVASLDVTLKVGPIHKSIRVFGDRRWRLGGFTGAPEITSPVPFSRMPLVYERAFGGEDADGDGAAGKSGWDERNPIGCGFMTKLSRDSINDRPLPNLEDPADTVRSWKDHPAPQGFGFIGRHWKQRRDHAGTYDERWQRERLPLLPEDFSDRYYQAAHQDLIAPRYLTGTEPVEITNVSPSGAYRFQLPGRSVTISAQLGAKEWIKTANLDTLVFMPDEGRFVMVYRGVFSGFESPWDISRLSAKVAS